MNPRRLWNCHTDEKAVPMYHGKIGEHKGFFEKHTRRHGFSDYVRAIDDLYHFEINYPDLFKTVLVKFI
jgi:hypothetical protein